MKFRKFETSSGKKVLSGKSAENNEELVAQVEKDEYVFHTAKPGSPFVNIKGKCNEKDRKEAAIFCAKYSQDWRDNKSDVLVHQFKGKNVHKRKGMKLGTFGVKKIDKIIKVKKEDIEKFIS
jgi:predicted ribosome quality control (RQC) complex YloA/Tae2 family protein